MLLRELLLACARAHKCKHAGESGRRRARREEGEGGGGGTNVLAQRVWKPRSSGRGSMGTSESGRGDLPACALTAP